MSMFLYDFITEKFAHKTYQAMTDRSTEHSAKTGQLPPAGQSSLEPASCRSLLPEISAGCPEEQQQSNLKGYKSNFMPGV